MIIINDDNFDPANWPEGVWGTYAPGSRIKVRKLTQTVIEGLRQPFVRREMQVDKVSRRMIPAETVDNDGYEDVLRDYLIEDHEGFIYKGNPLSRDLTGKKKLMNELAIRDFVWAFAQSQEVAEQEQHEEEIKNL